MHPAFLRVALLVSCLVSFRPLIAQDTGQSPAPAAAATIHAPDPDSGMAGHVDGLFIPLVPGQPFHAKVAVQIHRQLPDGTVVDQKYYTLVARDSTGRAHREARDVIPADSDLDPPLIRTIVYDPKTSLITNCYPDQRVCRQMSFDPTQHPVDEPVGPSSDGKSVLTREDLGKKPIDGLEVIGTRETRTFNPGAFGNDKPVVITKEIWYSPQLQFNLSVTRLDPRNGTQKLEVTDLKLGEPGPEWFVMPDGYRLVSGRGVMHPVYPAELEPLIEKQVSGISPDELTTALAPVEAAIGALAKAHAAAAPKDDSQAFAGQLRTRLSSTLRMMQQTDFSRGPQIAGADLRMNETFREVVTSPCIDKPQPGDPPSAPGSADGLREEQTAWLALRGAWVTFLSKLFPASDPATLGLTITNERDSELRRFQNIERNRGCVPEESIAPMLVRYVTGMSADQFDAALKPVDAAISDYAKAHADAEPGDRNQDFVRMIEQQLANDLNMRQHNPGFPQNQFQGADLRLNLVFRSVISSPCLTKPIPGDPPDAPVSDEKLRAEEKAWIAMRDAWTTFLATVFPGASQASLGAMLTQQRTGQLEQIQNIERNRGCVPEESIEPLLAQYVVGMTADQLDAAAKPVDAAIRAYGAAHAESVPNDQNENFVRMTEQQLAFELSAQQQNRVPTQDDFEGADLHLNQTWRAVISSPCLSKPIPGDPPNAPVSEEKLRAEERAWIAMR
ncbi:MAG: lysozyme inhibitor LprI family protein, partial [Terracidiphilus sp.]